MKHTVQLSKEEQSWLLERLFHTYSGPMYAYACKFLGSYANLAEDAVQNAWIRIAKHLNTVSTLAEPAIQSYILTCVKHCAVNMVKAETPVVPLEDVQYTLSARDPDILDQICDRESYHQVMEALHQLPDIYKDVLRLHYLSDLSLKEIAAMYELSYMVVKKRHTRGIEKLIRLIHAQENKQGGASYVKKK